MGTTGLNGSERRACNAYYFWQLPHAFNAERSIRGFLCPFELALKHPS
jgi:hypothetical protein